MLGPSADFLSKEPKCCVCVCVCVCVRHVVMSFTVELSKLDNPHVASSLPTWMKVQPMDTQPICSSVKEEEDEEDEEDEACCSQSAPWWWRWWSIDWKLARTPVQKDSHTHHQCSCTPLLLLLLLLLLQMSRSPSTSSSSMSSSSSSSSSNWSSRSLAFAPKLELTATKQSHQQIELKGIGVKFYGRVKLTWLAHVWQDYRPSGLFFCCCSGERECEALCWVRGVSLRLLHLLFKARLSFAWLILFECKWESMRGTSFILEGLFSMAGSVGQLVWLGVLVLLVLRRLTSLSSLTTNVWF